MEKTRSASSGYLAILFIIIGLSSGIYLLSNEQMPVLAIPILVISVFCIKGLTIINPNESVVCVLFGSYTGTIKKNGFFWVNPFYVKRKISLRARNLESEPIKVNDSIGNPIMIGVVLVWRVENTFKAAFEVDDYRHFVQIQSEAAIRNLAGSYPYDNFEEHIEEISLRSGGEEVNHLLEQQLSERLEIAGVHVMESRIAHLAYSSEIAGAMLQRQQATAIIAARQKIVEGAVGMVEMALTLMKEKNLIELDQDKKASMVSNLMVVLCSDKAANPVINAGTLYS